MAKTIQELEKENEALREENSLYKSNGVLGLYYELNRLVNETVRYSRGISIQSMLSETEKGDKTFERTQALIKNAKEHVIDLEEIRVKFNLTGNEQKDKERVPFIESVATKRD